MSRLLTIRVIGGAMALAAALVVSFGFWAAFTARWSLAVAALLASQTLIFGLALLVLHRSGVQSREARRDSKRLREVQTRTRKISNVQGGGSDVSMASIEGALDRHLTLVKDQVHSEIGILRSELKQQEVAWKNLWTTSASSDIAGDPSAKGSLAERLVVIERSTQRAFRQVERHLDKLSQVSIRETDALLQLNDRTSELGMRPLLGGWALSPSGVLQLLELVESVEPRLIVECGSGASTLYLAEALRRLGQQSSLIALEHDAEFAMQTRQALERAGLSDIAEVRHAALEPLQVGDWSGKWYDLNALEGLSDIGLLLVDGPPEGTGDLARFPAIPLIQAKLASNAVIVLDDARRDDEQMIVERWMQGGQFRRMKSRTDDQAVLAMGDGSARVLPAGS